MSDICCGQTLVDSSEFQLVATTLISGINLLMKGSPTSNGTEPEWKKMIFFLLTRRRSSPHRYLLVELCSLSACCELRRPRNVLMVHMCEASIKDCESSLLVLCRVSC